MSAGAIVRIAWCLLLFLLSAEAFSKLELVQVIFRHGDRTPEENELYPKLPYNPIYEKLGYGQLTEEGKMREYRLGTMLRKRYDEFLAGVHNYADIHAVSTDYRRTKMSLQLVLGGLYPPITNATEATPWCPVPVVYSPRVVDTIMLTIFCPKYLKELREVKASPAIQRRIAKYADLFEYLSVNTGADMTSDPVLTTARLFQLLDSQKSMNITLPDWATGRVQRDIEDVAALNYEIYSYTARLRRLNGGALLKEFIKNMNHQAEARGPKMYLYSGHEVNIAAFTKAHGLEVPRIPEYGSAVIVEKWRNIIGTRFIRMYLWTGVTEKLIALTIPKCGRICYYDWYLRLVQDVVPSDEESDCLWDTVTKKDLRSYYNERHD